MDNENFMTLQKNNYCQKKITFISRRFIKKVNDAILSTVLFLVIIELFDHDKETKIDAVTTTNSVGESN